MDVKCPWCERLFANSHGMKVHLYRSHRERYEKAGNRKAQKSLVERKVEEAKPKRQYKKHAKKSTATLGFCPRCGLELNIAAKALELAGVL